MGKRIEQRSETKTYEYEVEVVTCDRCGTDLPDRFVSGSGLIYDGFALVQVEFQTGRDGIQVIVGRPPFEEVAAYCRSCAEDLAAAAAFTADGKSSASSG